MGALNMKVVTRAGWTVALASVMVPLLAVAGYPSLRSSHPGSAPASGYLSAPLYGYVVDRQGKGVPGVCLDTQEAHAGLGPSTSSGRGGRYRLETRAPAGSSTAYWIWLTPCATSRNVAPEIYYHGDGYESRTAHPVQVFSGRATRLNFVLRTSATIEGTVTSALGMPLSNLCVSTETFGANEDSITAGIVTQVNTDAQGRYRLAQLVGDTHEVFVTVRCDINKLSPLRGGVSLGSGSVNLREGQTRLLNLSVPSGLP